MATQYLLPCECGQSLPVETSQAGQTKTCACGRKLTVPTFRAIRQLKPVGEPTSSGKTNDSTGNWTPAKGAVFAIGALLCIGGVVVTYHSYSIYSQAVLVQPSPAEFDASLEYIDQMSPADMLVSWQAIKAHGLEPAGSSPFAYAKEIARQNLRTMYAGLTMTILGLLAAIAPMVFSGKGQ